MTKYGFLGVGIMGRAMVANLLKAGYDVTVWNRSVEKCKPLLELGAHQGSDPATVVAACDVTFAMLADPVAAEVVVFGPQGVIKGMAPGKGYVDISTVDPATAVKIGLEITRVGGHFLEAPVSGSKKPAEDGTLVFLCGGDEDLYNDVHPLLEVMGKEIFYYGAAGRGARMKLVVNMVMGGMMTAFAEGLSLAEKAGLLPEEVLAVLDAGALANPMFRFKGPAMAEGRFETAFPLKHMQKDMRLALQLGDEYRQALYVAASANATFLKAREAGWGNEDFSAVFKAVFGS
ncbi:MAG: NAD(P)-dependent oxidoreductase [Desulfuromonas sp.]|nr:MAG: NAD(P)-dependent oxidoreductase [Desulfuromonas sp.]